MKWYLFTFLFSFLLIGSVHAQLDTNNNGMSDIWERHFNDGELFPPGILAEGDEDGDGQSNLDESLAGTDPFEFSMPDGYFKADVRHVPEDLGGPGPGNPEAYEISWYGVAGKQYILQASTDLKNWIPITTEPGEDKEIIIGCFPEDENDIPEIRFFWRVKVEDVDSDWDGLTDYEEILFGTDPLEWSTSYVDHNYDWDYDISDFRIAQHYELYADFDPDGDDDGDGVSNIDELWNWTDPHSNLDSDGDGMPDDWELFYGLDPDDSSDANGDLDSDGLTNLQEYQLGTDPANWDTDGDLLPDGWEVSYGLDPLDATGINGANGDPDNDDLPNLKELMYRTNPMLKDTDGDGVNDGAEVDQGSNPNNDADEGQAPPPEEIVEVPFSVGDPSGSYSERWKMIIQGEGPNDSQQIDLINEEFGKVETTNLKLRRGYTYTITLSHVATKNEYGGPDYDWQAQVDHKPTTTVLAGGLTHSGANRVAIIKDAWVLDNEDGLLGVVDQGFGSTNHAVGKVARLEPIDTITINTFIPHNNVEDPRPFVGTLYKGDNRNAGSPPRATWDESGSHRTQQKFKVIAVQALDSNGLVDDAFGANADGQGNSDRYVDIGETKSFDPATSLDASGNLTAAALADTVLGAPLMINKATAPKNEVWLVNPHFGAARKFIVQCRCEASNPLVTGAPAISYTLNITIDRGSGTYSIQGSHDGFPAYEIYINGKRVHHYDPLAAGKGLSALFPPEDITINQISIPIP